MSAIDDLATELSRLPGIGRKTALRLTYHLLRQPADQTRRLAQALVTLGERVRPCARCFNLTEETLCSICRDPRRDATIVCVVEQASDIGAIERAVSFAACITCWEAVCRPSMASVRTTSPSARWWSASPPLRTERAST